jgi:NAD(P)-dependent dehydrogenase (short-subunit alcohol dehydrogenase family)
MANTVFRSGATAVISGSAGGVGFAFARICRQHGMNLALLDRDTDNLNTAVKLLSSESKSSDLKTEGYTLDVSDLSAWNSTASKITSTFGPSIDLLMLNAGHAPKNTGNSKWLDVNYWHQTLDTNLFGVVNGIATFLPLIQKSEGPSSVVITGSKQGITNPPGNPAYNASKSAVKTIAEHLSHDLRTEGNENYSPGTHVHLLIPGWTFTGLSGNTGPTSSQDASAKKPKGAWLPEQCAQYGVDKIKAGKFYIVCPDNDVDEALDQARMTWGAGDVVESRSALSRWDELYKDDSAAWIQEEAKRRRGEAKGDGLATR